MRILLTFILCLLGVSAIGQPVIRGPFTTNAFSGTVVIPSGAGTITNITWANNTLYILDKGTNTVQTTYLGSQVDAPIQILYKTNITIRGWGWQSVVHGGSGGGTGTIFRVVGGDNIVFEDMAITGVIPANPKPSGYLFQALQIEGTNSVTVRNVLFKDHYDHGIYNGAGNTLTYKNTSLTVDRCKFENVGSLSNSPPRGDGAAIVTPGSNLKVINTLFTNCHIGIEIFEGHSVFTNQYRNILISENQFLGTIKECISSQGVRAEGSINDFQIVNNQMIYNRATYAPTWAYAMDLNDSKNIIIKDNLIKDAVRGISLNTRFDVEDILIADNIIMSCGYGVTMGESTGFVLQGVKVHNNIFKHNEFRSIYMDGGRNCTISDNQFNRSGTNDTTEGVITIKAFGTATISNVVQNNRFYVDNVTTPGVAANCLFIDTGVILTDVIGNKFSGFTAAAWSDAGTSTQFRDSMIGTNFAPRGVVLDALGITNCTAAMTIGAPQTLRLRLTVAASAAITLNGTTAITDGYFDGQILNIVMSDAGAGSVTVNDGANVNLGAATRALSNQDTLTLEYNANDAIWLEKDFTNN